MTTAVTQTIIDGFFDASNGDPFATLGMHETELGIEIRTLLPDASRVVVIERESGKEITELDCVDERGFLLVLFQIAVIFLLINYRFFGEMNRK